MEFILGLRTAHSMNPKVLLILLIPHGRRVSLENSAGQCHCPIFTADLRGWCRQPLLLLLPRPLLFLVLFLFLFLFSVWF